MTFLPICIPKSSLNETDAGVVSFFSFTDEIFSTSARFKTKQFTIVRPLSVKKITLTKFYMDYEIIVKVGTLNKKLSLIKFCQRKKPAKNF